METLPHWLMVAIEVGGWLMVLVGLVATLGLLALAAYFAFNKIADLCAVTYRVTLAYARHRFPSNWNTELMYPAIAEHLARAGRCEPSSARWEAKRMVRHIRSVLRGLERES